MASLVTARLVTARLVTTCLALTGDILAMFRRCGRRVDFFGNGIDVLRDRILAVFAAVIGTAVVGAAVVGPAVIGIHRIVQIGPTSITLVLASVAALAAAAASAPAAITVLAIVAIAVLIVLVFSLLRFRAQQRLTVGNRNLVVVGMNFTEGEETVTVAAIFDKGCLKRGFDAGYAGEVDVSFELLLVLGFKVEFFNTVTANDDNSCFLRVGGVYQHFVGHYFVSPRQPSSLAACGARPAAVWMNMGAGQLNVRRPLPERHGGAARSQNGAVCCGPFHDCA